LPGQLLLRQLFLRARDNLARAPQGVAFRLEHVLRAMESSRPEYRGTQNR
jgi:hypothetical protein